MIYAVDFDSTLCESSYPAIGAPNTALIEYLKRCHKQGDKLILWTCRSGELLKEAIEWCKQFGLEFNAINENLPETMEWYGNDCRKVFADIYIDDKAVNELHYGVGGIKMIWIISNDYASKIDRDKITAIKVEKDEKNNTYALVICDEEEVFLFKDKDMAHRSYQKILDGLLNKECKIIDLRE